MPVTRLLSVDDAEELADLVGSSRDFLAPWEPRRDDSYFTVDGQRCEIQLALERRERGVMAPHIIVDPSSPNGSGAPAVVGRINLTDIVRGAFQSAHLGYWVAQPANGRGLATAAVAEMKDLAFGELALHRIQAGTLTHNLASQTVLRRNGFEVFGTAPDYLFIDGRWQDHLLFQVLAGTGPPTRF